MYGILYVIVTFDTKHDKRKKLDCQTDKKNCTVSPLYGVPLCQLELMPRKGKIHFLARELTWQFKNCSLERQGEIRHEKTTMHDIYKQLRKTTMYARSCFYASKLHTWSWLNWSEISRTMLVETKFDLFSTKLVFLDLSTLFVFSLSFKTLWAQVGGGYLRSGMSGCCSWKSTINIRKPKGNNGS